MMDFFLCILVRDGTCITQIRYRENADKNRFFFSLCNKVIFRIVGLFREG